MKKLLILLLPLLLFMACPLEEEEDAPYNGTWVGIIDYVERTLTLDNKSFVEESDVWGKYRGSLEEIDDKTMKVIPEEYFANGIWIDVSTIGDFEPITYTWSLNEAGDKLTLVDISDQSVSVLTKQ